MIRNPFVKKCIIPIFLFISFPIYSFAQHVRLNDVFVAKEIVYCGMDFGMCTVAIDSVLTRPSKVKPHLFEGVIEHANDYLRDHLQDYLGKGIITDAIKQEFLLLYNNAVANKKLVDDTPPRLANEKVKERIVNQYKFKQKEGIAFTAIVEYLYKRNQSEVSISYVWFDIETRTILRLDHYLHADNLKSFMELMKLNFEHYIDLVMIPEKNEYILQQMRKAEQKNRSK